LSKVRLALLGCGDVAQRDYLPEFHRIADRAEIVAICARSESRVRDVAQQYQIDAWYTDYERMLAQSEFEAVINLTPIQLHAETTLAALQAGKHVYSEKPIATSVEQAIQIRETAARQNLIIVAAPCVMLFPQVQYVKSELEKGEIGEVYSARGIGHYGVPPWQGYPSDPSPFFANGAGPAMDMGVYPLHVLTGLLGPVQRVTAMTARVLKSITIQDGPFKGKEVPIEADDNWHIVLDFGFSRLATASAHGCIQDTLAPQVELQGLKGTIAVNILDVSAPVEMLKAGYGWEKVDLPQTGRLAGPDHHLGIEHLVDCIQNHNKPVLSIDHALHVIEIIEKAALSAREGKTLTLNHSF
jgi:predicted dehydrogenase